jgi:hypothetical protein
MLSLGALTTRTLQHLTRLEGQKVTLDLLADADLDLCMATLQRLVRREDGEIVTPHPDDRADLKCLARLGLASGHRRQGGKCGSPGFSSPPSPQPASSGYHQ